MQPHKRKGESARTVPAARVPAQSSDLEAFRAHYAETVAFTEALREGRCRRTNHFDARLGETVQVFQPLFAPWNMEILFFLYMRGAVRFNGLKRTLGVSSRVLTDKLRHLVEHGLATREEADEGRTVRYALSSRGEILARHLHPLVFFLHNEERLDLPAP